MIVNNIEKDKNYQHLHVVVTSTAYLALKIIASCNKHTMGEEISSLVIQQFNKEETTKEKTTKMRKILKNWVNKQ